MFIWSQAKNSTRGSLPNKSNKLLYVTYSESESKMLKYLAILENNIHIHLKVRDASLHCLGAFRCKVSLFRRRVVFEAKLCNGLPGVLKTPV